MKILAGLSVQQMGTKNNHDKTKYGDAKETFERY